MAISNPISQPLQGLSNEALQVRGINYPHLRIGNSSSDFQIHLFQIRAYDTPWHFDDILPGQHLKAKIDPATNNVFFKLSLSTVRLEIIRDVVRLSSEGSVPIYLAEFHFSGLDLQEAIAGPIKALLHGSLVKLFLYNKKIYRNELYVPHYSMVHPLAYVPSQPSHVYVPQVYNTPIPHEFNSASHPISEPSITPTYNPYANQSVDALEREISAYKPYHAGFCIEKWKHNYARYHNKLDAMPSFYHEFEAENWSVWYFEEVNQDVNEVSRMYEALQGRLGIIKHDSFGFIGVVQRGNEYLVEGLLLVKGTEVPVTVSRDSAFIYTLINVESEEGRRRIEDYWVHAPVSQVTQGGERVLTLIIFS
jgi:hypothetical protein